jgi:death-on-curing protein
MVIILSEDFIELLHDVILENDPTASKGYMQKSMIAGSLDRVMTHVYGLTPFPTVIDKAAALMYSIVTFHPFTDANKRTALLTTYFFLLFNGYNLEITGDIVNLLIKIGNGEIGSEKVVARWLSQKTSRNTLLTLLLRLIGAEKRDVEVPLESVRARVVSFAIQILKATKKIWPKT